MPNAFRSQKPVLVFIIAAVILLLSTSNLALAATPTLSSISPVNGSLGQTVSVTLTGTGFNAGGAFITVSGTGVGVTGVSVNSDTSLTATFLIAAGASANNRIVSVSTTGGTSGTVNFTVLGPPTLTSITSSGGAPSATVNLSGTNFPATGMTISISGTGVTLSSITPSNSQTLRTATFAIAPDAPAGPRNVTVSTAAGTSAPVTFTVFTQSQGYTISTVAGQGVIVEAGTATLQPLPTPNDVARDSSGNLYITIPGANKVYKVTPAGAISTFAGNGRLGSSGDGGPATSAELTFPVAVAVDDTTGYVYIAEGNEVRKVAGDGTISTYAGRAAAGFSGDGGLAIFAQFSNPSGLGIDSAGNLYVVDQGNSRIRKITGGVISTVAGNGTFGYGGDTFPATAASLGLDGATTKLAIDGFGNLYIPDSDNRVIRMVAANGTISTIAGGGSTQGDNGPASAARLGFLTAVAVDSSDPAHLKLFLVEQGNNRIRVITGSSTAIAGGIITTAAGNGGFLFNGDGPVASVQLSNPSSVAVGSSGNVYFTDSLSNRVRLLSGGVITTIAGNAGVCSGVSFCGADNGQATAGQLYLEQGVATDPSGNLFIADSGNGRIRKVSSSNNTITTIAGNGSVTDSSIAVTTTTTTSATLTAIGIPWAVASTTSGIVYAAASTTLFGGTDSRIWKILPDGSISTVAGGSTSGNMGDQLNGPLGIVVNQANGNIYIADTCNFRVRMLDVATGTITTIAGNGTQGYSGDGGQAVQAQLGSPRQLALDSAGNLYIADNGSHDGRCTGEISDLAERTWKVATNGTISTFSTFGGSAVAVANIGGSDNIFVANSTNIGRFYSDGSSIVIAGGGFVVNGSGYSGFSGDNGAALPALISVASLAVNGTTGDLFMADQGDNVVRKLTPVAPGSTVIHAVPFGIQVRGGGAATSTTSIVIALPGGVFSWNATASITTTFNGANWLSVSPSSGTASQFSFGALTATFTVAGLAVGSYNGSITITCTDANAVNGPLTIPVTLTILPAAIATNPVGLIVNSSTNNPQGFLNAGAQNPPSQTINVFNPGVGGTINFMVAASPQGSWLSVSPLTGSASGTSTPLTTSYNIAGLSAGTYTGAITISWNGVGAQPVNSPVTVPVTLNLSPLTFPAPGLNSISPVNGGQGQTVNVTLNGSNFLAVTPTVTVSGAGVTVTAATAVTTSLINAIFAIDPAAATGARSVTVTTAAGTSGSMLFTVLGPPTLSSISPPTGTQGSTVSTTFTGTNFVNGATAVTVAGTGVTATVLDATSTTSRTVLLAIAPDAAIGPRGVTVSTAAGTSGSVNFTVASEAGYIISRFAGQDVLTIGGTATSQPLTGPSDVAQDSSGNLYIASQLANKVFKVTPGGVISTFAGTGTVGNAGDGGPAVSAQLNSPRSVVVDPNNNVLIADANNQRIRKVATDLTISTFAGTGTNGFGGDGGPAIFANLSNPTGLGIDPAGNLYISDANNRRIRKVSTTGGITTVAGNGTSGFYGDNGPAVLAQLNLDTANGTKLAIDGSGNIYIPDTLNHRIRKVDSNGMITTFAGTGVSGFSGDGGALLVNLSSPRGVSLDPISGGLFIADSGNNRIRKLVNGTVSTVAGNSGNGFNGDGSPATSFNLTNPTGLWTDSSGNLYFADVSSNRVRRLSGTTLSTMAGNTGHTVYTGALPGDGGPATSSALYAPNAVALDPLTGNLLIADTREYRLRQVDSSGNITTIAGTGSSQVNGDGAAAASAAIGFVQDIAVDSSGNVYLAGNNLVRKINRGPGNAFGNISTIAGNGNAGFSGDGVAGGATAPGQIGELNNPNGLAIDNSGNVYIADSNNNRIRLLTVATSTLSTVAGTGFAGSANINGPATSAQLNFPRKLAFISNASIYGQGNLYIADGNNQRIVVLTNQNLNLFSTFGGNAVAYSAGNLYISSLSLIQRAFPDGTSSTIAGNGFGISGDGGPALLAAANAFSMAPAADGTLYFADNSDNVVRKLTPVSAGSAVLSASPLGFNVRLGNNSSLTNPLNITLAGSGTFTWNATTSVTAPAGSEWLTVSPATGTGGFPLNVTFNASGLAPGIYNGSITISSPAAVNSSVIVPVTLNVLPATLSTGLSALSPSATASGANPTSLNFTVNNTGSGASLGFTAVANVATPQGGSWLSVSPGAGNTPSGNFTVSYNISGLSAGIYNGSITITSVSASNSPVIIPVTLTINPNGLPTLTAITPSSGSPGQTVFATLTGTNFSPGSTSITVPGGSGLSVSNVTFINATTVYAIFAISNTAALASNNVTVTTPNGTTGAVTFTVSALKKRGSQITSQ